mgnify:CR=1 FL=1
MEMLIESPKKRLQMGAAALKLVEENRGAVQLTMELIENALNNTELNDAMKRRRYIDKVKGKI